MNSREHIARKAAVMSTALDGLQPTYEHQNGSNPIGACREVPSETEVLRILRLLDDVFYPGFRSDGARSGEHRQRKPQRTEEAKLRQAPPRQPASVRSRRTTNGQHELPSVRKSNPH